MRRSARFYLPLLVFQWCVCWAAFSADSAGAPTSAGLFTQRIAESTRLLASYNRLTPAGANVVEQLGELSDRLGRMPTYREFMEQLSKLPDGVSRDDFSILYWLFCQAQVPKVSKPELTNIVREWDAGIRSVDVQYRVEIAGGTRAGTHRTTRFALDGLKLLLDQKVTAAAAGQEVNREVQAYDGEQYRDVRADGQESLDRWDTGSNVVVRVHPLDSLVRFFDPANPFCRQGILNVQRRFEQSGSFQEFVADSTVYESFDTVNDVECICVGNEFTVYYLSPKHGFALIAARENEFDYSPESGRVFKDGRYVEQNCEEMFLATEGLWMPRKIVSKLARDAETEISETVVTTCRVNDPIDDKIFSDVVPAAAGVTDPSKPHAYQIASPEEIEKSLDPGLNRNKYFGRWFIAANVIALLLLSGAMLLQVRRKR